MYSVGDGVLCVNSIEIGMWRGDGNTREEERDDGVEGSEEIRL